MANKIIKQLQATLYEDQRSLDTDGKGYKILPDDYTPLSFAVGILFGASGPQPKLTV